MSRKFSQTTRFEAEAAWNADDKWYAEKLFPEAAKKYDLLEKFKGSELTEKTMALGQQHAGLPNMLSAAACSNTRLALGG